ncbi:WXG100 family type VII secretion target [Streptomyces sp. PTM05]|uniref:WXG100 family type VII secretion target n=1 Tax=Streptantibioticus parmotrematis TaxID=2873249 RepID=A0ABS7QYW0_9ACTN|nr:WXG100 family type VII secretion target [Streptantibioticus parmotrematis]MBY8886967.1 WXG100 family type VII secretion target [Streptantibioticus parmotrematis]
MAGVDSANLMVGSDLSGSGAWINNKAQEIVEELNTLIKQLQPITETWTGDAAKWYYGLQQEWNYAANGLLGPDGVLGEIAQAMHVNWNNYSEAEWSNVTSWQHM